MRCVWCGVWCVCVCVCVCECVCVCSISLADIRMCVCISLYALYACVCVWPWILCVYAVSGHVWAECVCLRPPIAILHMYGLNNRCS